MQLKPCVWISSYLPECLICEREPYTGHWGQPEGVCRQAGEEQIGKYRKSPEPSSLERKSWSVAVNRIKCVLYIWDVLRLEIRGGWWTPGLHILT